MAAVSFNARMPIMQIVSMTLAVYAVKRILIASIALQMLALNVRADFIC